MWRIERMRPARVAGLGMLAVAALLWLGAGASARAATRAAAACPASKLVVWLDTQAGGGAAGSFYTQLDFTNLSAHACTLSGFPGVSGVSLAGKQLGSAAEKEPSARSAAVTLAPRGAATARLQIVDAGNYPKARCAQKMAAGLRVYPPGQRAAKTVPFPFEACSKRGPVYLRVGPVKRHG